MPFTRTPDATLTAATESLGTDSYTVHRLQHASPEHLYLTTRRCFVGPIPEGWLKSHRKQWYRHYLGINHSSKVPSFSAAPNVGRQRRITGLDGPSASAVYHASFPQPDDVVNHNDEEENENENEDDEEDDADDADDDRELRTITTTDGVQDGADSDGEATIRAPYALEVPRSGEHDERLLRESQPDADEVLSSYNTARAAPSQKAPSSFPESSPSPASTPKGMQTAYVNQRPAQTLHRRETSGTSYVTASDGDSIIVDEPGAPDQSDLNPAAPDMRPNTMQTAHLNIADFPEVMSPASIDTQTLNNTGANASDTSLLADQHTQQLAEGTAGKDTLGTPEDPIAQQENPLIETEDPDANQARPVTRGLVRFNVPDAPILKQELQMRAKMAQGVHGFRKTRLPRRFTRGKLKDGEIVKMEKMLVRMDVTAGSEQPNEDYDEKDSQRVETRTTEKWREFMVVCRESHEDEAVLCLQMYKTRVIPATNETKTKKRCKHEILLDPTRLRVNLYSSLDKTLVLWRPKGAQTSICFLRPRSSASSVEWYTFLQGVLGWHRTRTLQINIPDLSVSLRLDNPFEALESSEALKKAAEGDEDAIAKTMKAERAIAAKIIDRCMDMLSDCGEWDDVIHLWSQNDRVGLAWKRYDRLEWVHGINENKMYGTMALQRTHELELRPKQHYPLNVKMSNGESLQEPAPVEGFLIRLTSQKGTDQKFGKLFFKRLYFTTHNQYLLFLRPAKAVPPPPPKMPMKENSKIPSSKQISEKIPLIYGVNPYPMHEGAISWLASDSTDASEKQKHDRDAYDEAERNAQALLHCDGFINLCDIVKVRKVHRGATPADEAVEEGSDVDFDADVPDSHHDDGTTKGFDDERTFELLMKNGLVVRLQAFSKATKKEWIKRLRALSQYWTQRASADLSLFKAVRKQNLETLNIDMNAEAYVGQFAHKWEVTKSFASPELYNMCGISNCRTIHRSGILFRKPRVHSTFTRCHVILCHGHLLIFKETLRSTTGKKVIHVHHERIAAIDLRDCYLYAGLITQNDLLYQNRTFDNNRPGNTALPRMYLEDGWSSSDEDAMTCFVLWHGQRKGWFRAKGDTDDVREGEGGNTGSGEGDEGKRDRLKRVSQLGVMGRSVVFRARSRAERDHWVLGIQTEIERLGQQVEVRVEE